MADADIIAGYKTYIDLIADLDVVAGKDLRASGMRRERDRCRDCLDLRHTVQQVRAVAVQNEQRIVDTDRQAKHQAQGVGCGDELLGCPAPTEYGQPLLVLLARREVVLVLLGLHREAQRP